MPDPGALKSQTAGMPQTIAGKLDTRFPQGTPEGVSLSLNPAGPSVRIHAYLIDLVLRGVLLLVAALVFQLLGGLGSGLLLVSYFLLEWLYPVLFEIFRDGQTPGKRYCRLRVLHRNGTPVTPAGSVVRNLLRVVDILPVCYAAGMVSMVVSGHFQRLGDLVAGTLVVREPPGTVPVVDPDAGLWVPPVRLEAAERQAIVRFAERSQELSAERRQELAAILLPLTGQSGQPAVRQLKAIANGLIGPGP